MRFGQDFHRHIIPEWDEHYINYNLLKRLAKSPTLSGAQDDTSSLIEHLGNAIYAFESFMALQEGISEIMEGQFCVFFGLGTVDPATIPDIEKVRPFELRVLFEAYSDVHRHLKKVQWFERVNAEGLQRIFSKFHRRGDEASEPYHSLEAQWSAKQAEKETRLLSRLDRIGGLRESLEHALSLPEPPESISLYLQHSPSRSSGSTRRHVNDMQQALWNGDMNALVQLVTIPPTLPAEGSQASYPQAIPDLLRFSVLLKSEQSSALLRVLLPSSDERTVDAEVLAWSIDTAGRERLLAPRSDMSHGPRAPSSSPLRAVHAMIDAIESSEPAEDGVRLIKDRHDAMHFYNALHSAANYGLLEICKRLLEMLDKGGRALEALLSVDLGSLTPLHLAVAGGHTLTAKYLIDSLGTVEVGYRTRSRRRIMGEALQIALRNQNDEIIGHLLRGNADTGHKSARGETALHIAAQLGRADYAALLIPIMLEQGVGLDVRDTSRGWTPLFSACAGAHHDVVKLLLQAGLSHQATDLLGWTAREHAVFKGHLTVDVPDSFNVHGFTDGPASLPVAGTVHAIPRCREAESVIIACLGNTRKDRVVKAVDLSCWSSAHSPGQYQDVSYMLEVAAPGATCEPRRVRLPILDDTINDPFVFPVSGTAEPRLVFRIFRLRSGAAAGEEVLVAGGTALLESNVHCFGVKRQSLIREHTAAILDRETMLVAGTVTFTVLIAKPFPHLQTARSVDVKRKPSCSPLLVGHRGRGMNLKTQEYLQLGENTVESLVSAGRLGASFVEFDVQITKDLEAVAYHDFSLSESGTDVPVHDLTLDQYMYASNVQSPHANPLSLLGRAGLQDPAGRQRSRSLGQHFEAGAAQIQDRMKHTVAFKRKGFNANTRGSFIQDSFATLKQILAQLPPGIGCDIEIKYPRLHEAASAGVAPIAIELNTFVDVVLDILHQHGGDRQIFLSSFTPEICILLSMKQQAYPVFFITNAGKVPMIDLEVRAASLQVAVQFARRWNLAGVVFACEALLLCPRLVGFVKARNLVCASYGVLNNEPENVKLQAEAGVDIVIVDRVGLIAKTLAAVGIKLLARLAPLDSGLEAYVMESYGSFC